MEEEYSVETERHEAIVVDAFNKFCDSLFDDWNAADVLNTPVVELLAMAHSIGFQDGMEYANEDIMKDIENIEESDENSES
jgi:hypothetical protein